MVLALSYNSPAGLACRRISNLTKQDASRPAHRGRGRAVSEGGAAQAGQSPEARAQHDGRPDHAAEVPGEPHAQAAEACRAGGPGGPGVRVEDPSSATLQEPAPRVATYQILFLVPWKPRLLPPQGFCCNIP